MLRKSYPFGMLPLWTQALPILSISSHNISYLNHHMDVATNVQLQITFRLKITHTKFPEVNLLYDFDGNINIVYACPCFTCGSLELAGKGNNKLSLALGFYFPQKHPLLRDSTVLHFVRNNYTSLVGYLLGIFVV